MCAARHAAVAEWAQVQNAAGDTDLLLSAKASKGWPPTSRSTTAFRTLRCTSTPATTQAWVVCSGPGEAAEARNAAIWACGTTAPPRKRWRSRLHKLCFPGLAPNGRSRSAAPSCALTLELPTYVDGESCRGSTRNTAIYFGFGGGMQLPSFIETAMVITAACAIG